MISADVPGDAGTAGEPEPAQPRGEDVDEIGSDTLDSLLAESPAPEPVEAQEEIPEESPSRFEESPSPALEEQTPAEEPEPAVSAPLEPEDDRSEDEVGSSGLSTMTIAELYEKQGYPEKAVEVYQHILIKEPERKDIRLRIENLKDQMLGLSPEGDVIGHDVRSALRRKRIEVLGTWLRKIKEEGNV